MKTSRRCRFISLALGVAAVLLALSEGTRAGGPLFVGGPGMAEGQPFRWLINPFNYWTDRGMLGNQTETQANQLVAEAFQVWQDVQTATLTFTRTDALPQDINASNYLDFENRIASCSQPLNNDTLARDRSIVYDADGSVIDLITGSPDEVIGFASVICMGSDGTNNVYTRGLAVLNGKFIDGNPDTFSNPEISLAEFRAVFIHEFGHLLGLDHSQINVNCLTSFCTEGSPDSLGVPTMFPFLLNLDMATPTVDDEAAFSALYPESSFAATTGTIRGRIFFSDGQTQGQGFNVIARRVGDPGVTAISSVSGYLYTADAGNPLVRFQGLTPSPFGSRDQSLIGFYQIPGLPPGDYTVEVEAIDPEFVEDSGVGPISSFLGFNFPLPGPAEFWNSSESATDNPGDSTPITVGAGQTVQDRNIILNGTPPRFDAWED